MRQLREIKRKRKKLAEAGDLHAQLVEEKKRRVHARRLAVRACLAYMRVCSLYVCVSLCVCMCADGGENCGAS
jgi:hypothetical protein